MTASTRMGRGRYGAAVRAVLIGNAGGSDAGFVGNRLRERGFTFTEGQREHPAGWPALDGVELVLTLGSEWNVYRPETAASVEAEAQRTFCVRADHAAAATAWTPATAEFDGLLVGVLAGGEPRRAAQTRDLIMDLLRRVARPGRSRRLAA